LQAGVAMTIDAPAPAAERRQAQQKMAALVPRVVPVKDTASAIEAACFPQGTIDPAGPSAAKQRFNQVTRRAVIRPVRVHSFRTFAPSGWASVAAVLNGDV